MASEFSFDISCGFDKQEFANALDQTKREIQNRFDFKNVLADIDLKDDGKELVIHTESDHKLIAILDILESKLVKRNVALSVLDKSKEPESASGGSIRKHIKLIDTLSSEQVKELSKIIRDKAPKVKPVIQGDSIRVTSKSKDDLQETMNIVRQAKPNLPIKFDNYR